jgi:putative membrane protein
VIGFSDLSDRIAGQSHRSLAAAILALGAVEFTLVSTIPAYLPVWLPYDFSWGVFLTVTFTIVWFMRGFAFTPVDERPARWRLLAFFLGIGLIYVSMQTYIDYAAQHMFFIHRLQHVVLHHTGPFLIALSDPAAIIARGMPDGLRHRLAASQIRRVLEVVQQPVIATLLFVGLILLWPAPPVHFYAMLDPRLYTVMNWSVTVDGILFWALILDPRPMPHARLGYGPRAFICLAIIPPQILLGAIVTFSTRDHFEVYAICGRIIAMTGLEDQQLAGLILWIPPSMMSVIGTILVLNFLRLDDERSEASISNGMSFSA